MEVIIDWIINFHAVDMETKIVSIANIIIRYNPKHIIKNIIQYTVVTGVAKPIRINDVSGSFDINIDTGILMQNSEEIPCIITGILFPHPLKYPILLKSTHVRMQSSENPLI